MPSAAALVAVDWGTSSLRGALLDADGRVLDERARSRGILTVSAGGFPAVFEEVFGDWMRSSPTVPCLVSGMAGSAQGWLPAPYCACPAGLGDVADALAWVEPGRIAIVAGLRCENRGVPDVMRGEETQVFGVCAELGLADAVCILPGTHSKWVEVRAGRIERFSTQMTGEVYALLRRQSILARTLPEGDDGPPDEPAFDRGVAFALESSGLLQAAFGVRTLALFDRLPLAALPAYLSGLVIGEELRAQSRSADAAAWRELPVVVVGDPRLTSLYARALRTLGIDARQAGGAATWRGLWNIAALVGKEKTP